MKLKCQRLINPKGNTEQPAKDLEFGESTACVVHEFVDGAPGRRKFSLLPD